MSEGEILASNTNTPSKTEIPVSHQARTNAMVSYFFLGWMMLIAKANPQFQDPFVRSHAKSATRIHLTALIFFLVYFFIIKELISFTLPILGISFNTVIMTLFITGLMGYIIVGAFRAYREKNALYSLDALTFQETALETQSIEHLTEQERVIVISSYIPFVGLFIASRYPEAQTREGIKVGGMFIFLIFLSILSSGYTSMTTLILILLSIAFIVSEAVWIFLHGAILRPRFLDSLPSIDIILLHVRVAFRYVLAFIPVIFGKGKKIVYMEMLQEEIQNIQKNPRSPLFTPAWLIGIPFLNLIFVPMLIRGHAGMWKGAILQGLILDILLLLVIVIGRANSPLMLFFLFPIFRMIAIVPTDPEAKVPFLYEILLFLNTMSFGKILSNDETKKESLTFQYTPDNTTTELVTKEGEKIPENVETPKDHM